MLILVSTVDTITNPEVSIELLQVEAVGGKVVPDTVELYVCDPSQRIVSSVARVVADRTDADAARRTLQATLSIRNGVGTSERERYQLMCRSERTGETSVLATLRIALMASADDPWSW